MTISISHKDIRHLITALGYHEKGGDSVWEKRYANHADYTIAIDFSREEIDYKEPIKLGDKSTSNFANSENFVVLECVDRLLAKGYKPEALSLEHKWSLGRQHKGKLDILVKDGNEQTYLMVECKTWRDEYDKEKKRMEGKDGGQLFSYYQQDKNAQYLCLYTSRLKGDEVEYQNDIVQAESVFKNLGEVKEVYNRWNKQFSNHGIFDDDIQPYRITLKALTRKDLKSLQEEDGSRIYNHFLEILRHNVVSDKGNAFNKIFNLFLCKILDEDKGDDAQTDFQWVEGQDNHISLLSRLNDLYKRGMKQYLEKEITDYTQKQIDKYKKDEDVYTILQELRLYKNQEFAFVEVFNKDSFEENASIVKEVVQLLQGWKLRYTHKQQFLGEFFELLLNTGFKQESGQFFTPVPLVRFIIQSLPIKEVMNTKIGQGEKDFLPYVIDFACGSGHFLTEMMDVLQGEIDGLDDSALSPSQKSSLQHFKHGDFAWASEFVYGIERDYRLVKTTKLACFLHGDGEAKIVHASGLEQFTHTAYRGKLEAHGQENLQFDILVANPPYSVKGFRSTIKNGDDTFNLFEHISDNSSEIEVLFIERMKQLVKPHGLAAIILPQSILSNAGNYTHARKMVLEHFSLKALVLLGSNAFMATGTNTAIFFLKKRQHPLALDTKADYQNMAAGQTLVVVNSGEKEEEKRFMGYEFSNRRGSEGIKQIGEGCLLEEGNLLNPTKANSYILRSMKEETIDGVDASLQGHVHTMPLANCFDWEADTFANAINPKKKLIRTSKYPLVKLGEIAKIQSGGTPSTDAEEYWKGGIVNWVATEDAKQKYMYGTKRKITVLGLKKSSAKLLPVDTVLFSSRATIGEVCIAKVETATNQGFQNFICNREKTHPEFLYYVLKYEKREIENLSAASKYKEISRKKFAEFKIPLPSLATQQAFVKELNDYQKVMDEAKKEVKGYAPSFEVKPEWERVDMKDYVEIKRGTSITSKSTIEGSIPVIAGGKTPAYFHDKANRAPEAITISGSGANAGFVNFHSVPIFASDCFTAIAKSDKLNQKFLFFFLQSRQEDIYKMQSGSAQPHVYSRDFENFKIPLPPLATQQAIVERLNAEQAEIDTKKALITQMEEKIEKKLSTLWQEEST